MRLLDRLLGRPPGPTPEAKPTPNAIAYDCEIIRVMPTPDVKPDPTLEYCGGWTDFEGMGISCICAYDFASDRYHVFLKDNLADFQTLNALWKELPLPTLTSKCLLSLPVNLSGADMVVIFHKTIVHMQEFVRQHPAPFIAKIYRDGSINMWKDDRMLLEESNQ